MVSAAALLQRVLSISTLKPTNLTDLFGPELSPKAQIILPTDAAWRTEVRARWTDYKALSYLGAIKPATEEDVQVIVSFTPVEVTIGLIY